jgi:PRC-barrel domain
MNGKGDPDRPLADEPLPEGTPVYDREGRRIGTVKKALWVEEEDIFDGVVIDTDQGSRFIDAPEVARVGEDRVELALGGDEVARRPAHEESPLVYEARVPSSRLQDFWRRITLRRLWRRD